MRARLAGFQEVPAISTPGGGDFSADLSADGLTLTWTLTYAGLKGNSGEGGAVTGAHVHLGQRGVAGGVAIHLCGGGGGTEACPAPPATLTGTATADGVVGPAGQGLAAGQLADLVAAMRAGVTYVNVHTTQFPSGEIRGQLRASHQDDDEHERDDD
ncbi:MAG: CHRD domain-containing protein [Deltaproteobacteria bacterium]|nr:CHRD domain-containing protein [Deltaproteobacteria bacterium]